MTAFHNFHQDILVGQTAESSPNEIEGIRWEPGWSLEQAPDLSVGPVARGSDAGPTKAD